MTKQQEILIIGGSGKTGRRVAARLRALGAAVRTASRSSSARFDWEDENSWEGALRGTSAAYVTFYPDLAVPWAAEPIGKLSRLAVDVGVRKLVLLSGRGEHQVWPAERAVREAGAAYTIVRSAFFNQNFDEGHFRDALRSGELAFPAGNVREPFVDADDIADVVTSALTDARHDGQIYDLTGPRLLSFAEAVQEIAQASGKPLRYQAISGEAYAAALAPYLPAAEVAFLVELFGMLLDGHNALLTDGVQRALGRKPKDFSDYAREAWR